MWIMQQERNMRGICLKRRTVDRKVETVDVGGDRIITAPLDTVIPSSYVMDIFPAFLFIFLN